MRVKKKPIAIISTEGAGTEHTECDPVDMTTEQVLYGGNVTVHLIISSLPWLQSLAISTEVSGGQIYIFSAVLPI